MENFKLNIAYLAMFVMIFASCSKEETGVQDVDPEKATLSFGALLNDFTKNPTATKAHLGFLDGVPECSEGTAAYVVIGLSLDGESIEWADGEERLRVDLVDGQMFTKEDSELELDPDEYVLDYFAVYNDSGTMIWLAPMGGDDDDLSGFVDNALPLSIDLRAGVKKYVEVEVLCYDDRFVNQYGYLFFEIDDTEAIKFCIFGNYCDEEGKHYPASYSVSIWSEDSSSGTMLYSDVANVTGIYDNGDAYAEPVCFALPDTEGEDEYYFEITLLNSDAYGNVTEEVIRAGVITDADVRALYVDDEDENTIEYYHFREGNCNLGDMPDLLGDDPDSGNECDPTDPSADCDDDGTLNKCDQDNPNYGSFDCDGDNIVNSEDDCPTEAGVEGPDGENGCVEDNECDPTDPSADCDDDGTLNKCDQDNPNYGSFDCDGDNIINSEDDCPTEAGVEGPDGENGCVEDNECDATDPSADCDGDGTLNKCDQDNPNYGSFDCDGDNIINSEDDCPTEAGVEGPDGENGCVEDNECDATDPSADCDEDGTLNKCDQDNPNYGSFDCDGDNIMNSEDDCPTEAGVEGPDGENGCVEDNKCDATDPSADCDGDGTLNKCDQDNPNYGSFDCDGDGFINSNDSCPTEAGVAGGVGGDGCPKECKDLASACVLNTEGALGEFCEEAELAGANAQGWVKVNSAGDRDLLAGIEGEAPFGTVSLTVNASGDLTVTLDGFAEVDRITAYAVEVRPSYSNGTMSETCWESLCANLGAQGTMDDVALDFDGYDYSYPFFIKVNIIICGEPIGNPDN